MIFLLSPIILVEMMQVDEHFFFKWVVQPPSRVGSRNSGKMEVFQKQTYFFMFYSLGFPDFPQFPDVLFRKKRSGERND